MPGKRAKSSMAEPPTRAIVNEKDNRTNSSSPQKPVVITAFRVDMFQQLTLPNDPTQTQRMRTVVHIQPESIWASLPKYRNCIIRGEKYSVHQYAIVSRSQPLPKPFHPFDRDLQIPCVARILEVCAADPKNVWLRLYWLYRPEEIPGGRREYHGKDELIISNHMEIVDALQVKCPVQVRRWKEEENAEEEDDDDDNDDDGRHLPAAETREKEALYFRQTYDFVTRKVSPEGTNGGAVGRRPGPPQIQFRQQHEDVVFSASMAGEGGEHFRIETIESQRAENKGRVRFCITDLWEEDNRLWEVDFQCAKCLARIL
ncbi:MAG: hypothetical protein L6R35_000856 [Caloplaca aegaea]|nr:MAG: hypothetical protein L6R35_000856 [Caloplaca aegaea]